LVGALCFCGPFAAAQQKPASASAPATAVAQPAGEASATTVRQLKLANKPWTGDFDAMLEHRVIRVLVPYSRTLYFSDKGHERGLTAELVRDFERYLNKRGGRDSQKIRHIFATPMICKGNYRCVSAEGVSSGTSPRGSMI